MRTSIYIAKEANGHLIGSRHKAIPMRQSAEASIRAGEEVVMDFSKIQATQSFIDELVGGLILRFGPDVLDRLIFKSCSEDVRAILEFVVADRCEQYLTHHSH